MRRGAARREHATAPKPVHPTTPTLTSIHTSTNECDDGRKQDEHVRETTTEIAACITSFASLHDRRHGGEGLGACVPSGGG